MEPGRELVGFVDRKRGEPFFTVTLSDAGAALLVTGCAGSHLESLHPMLGSLAESIDPENLRPYVMAAKGTDELSDESATRVIGAVMQPVEWMKKHTDKRLDISRNESTLVFDLFLTEAYWLGATVEVMTEMFEHGSAQRMFLEDLGQNLSDLFVPAELMLGWDIEQGGTREGLIQ